MTSKSSAPPFLSHEDAVGRLDWPGAVEALRQGHALPRAEIRDVFLGPPSPAGFHLTVHPRASAKARLFADWLVPG